jgi:hypothetical protein
MTGRKQIRKREALYTTVRNARQYRNNVKRQLLPLEQHCLRYNPEKAHQQNSVKIRPV